jgi:hypothetical protein
MKYLIVDKEKVGFPFIIHFYKKYHEIGDIEVYRTGKVYFKDFPIQSGMSVNDTLKALKIVKKELRKQKIRTWFKSC